MSILVQSVHKLKRNLGFLRLPQKFNFYINVFLVKKEDAYLCVRRHGTKLPAKSKMYASFRHRKTLLFLPKPRINEKYFNFDNHRHFNNETWSTKNAIYFSTMIFLRRNVSCSSIIKRVLQKMVHFLTFSYFCEFRCDAVLM